MPSNHCMLTCMKVQPPDSYWLTVIQKRPITNRKHPHWVEQLAECDTRVRSAPRPRGRWGICRWTAVQQQIPQTSWSVGYLSLVSNKDRDTDRQREGERDRQTERQRQRERARDTHTDRLTERERELEREREGTRPNKRQTRENT